MYTINKINNNEIDIQVVKGNTFREQIQILNDARLGYIPCPGDEIFFQVYNKYIDDTPIFEKKIPYDTLILELKANETAKMRIRNYVYKIKLIRQNGDVDDFIHGKFLVKGMIE